MPFAIITTSSKTTPKVLYELFNRFSFDGSRFKLSDLDKLEPRYDIRAEDYTDFCREVAQQIHELYPSTVKVADNVHSIRTTEHLLRKIQSADKILAGTISKIITKYPLTQEDVEIVISVGPYESDFGMTNATLQLLSEIELEQILHRRTGSIRNLIYNLRDRYSISGKDFKRLNLTSGN